MDYPSDHPYFEDYPEVDRKSCQLLGPTALVSPSELGLLTSDVYGGY